MNQHKQNYHLRTDISQGHRGLKCIYITGPIFALDSFTLAIRYLIIIRGECKVLNFEEKNTSG